MTRRIGLGLALCFAALAVAAARAQDVPGEQETVRRAIHVCTACHGEGGRSATPGVPSLAGQPRQYLIEQLSDFRAQTRVEAGPRAYMWGVSALLDDAAIAGLAEYYAAQTPPSARPGDRALEALGRALFVRGDPPRGIRACASCHGEGGEGAVAFPRLAGQRADYVEAQLSGFGTRLRPHGVLMKNETRQMTRHEMRAVARFVESL